MNKRIHTLAVGTPLVGIARILRSRAHGGVQFATVRFMEQEVQLMFIRNETLGFEIVKDLSLGSLVEVKGELATTRSGQQVIKVHSVTLIAQSRRPLPDKWHGVAAENRYANRGLDFLANPAAFEFMLAVSEMTSAIRSSLREQGFREYNTGILQNYFEGGLARSFETRVRARNRVMSLSLTSELKLKRLIIAGITDAYEISESFRNEGIDNEHAPEFTLLEAYRVGATHKDMCLVLQSLVQSAAQVFISRWQYLIPKDDDRLLQLQAWYSSPFCFIPYHKACENIIGAAHPLTLDWLIAHYPDLFSAEMPHRTWMMKCIEQLIVPKIDMPTFLTHIPADYSPLVRTNRNYPEFSDCAFFCAGKTCIADISEDETDPERIQRSMEEQSQFTNRPINTDYLSLLEFGIPSTAGFGMGLNRLYMAFLPLTSLPMSIKETQIFPIY